MDLPRFSCPENSFLYNSTLCWCNPGYYKEEGGKGCVLFEVEDGDWAVGMTGVAGAAGLTFLEDLLPLDDVRRMVRSEAALLKTMIVAVVFWLAFCAAVRLGRVDGGRTVWFRVRWRISRLDLRFATKHHLVLLLETGPKMITAEELTGTAENGEEKEKEEDGDTQRRYSEELFGARFAGDDDLHKALNRAGKRLSNG